MEIAARATRVNCSLQSMRRQSIEAAPIVTAFDAYNDSGMDMPATRYWRIASLLGCRLIQGCRRDDGSEFLKNLPMMFTEVTLDLGIAHQA